MNQHPATVRAEPALARSPFRSILVVKLADMGDVLTATPAMRALREAYPRARIDALVTPVGARVLEGFDALDGILSFRKAAFDRPAASLPALRIAIGLASDLRGRYEAVVLLHHLTTTWGTAKYTALALASGARVRAGLDNGRGWFLSHRARDHGFGERHEVEYWLSVAAALGASPESRPIDVPISEQARRWAARRWSELGLDGRAVALVHPGSGAYSLARRWFPDRFARVGDDLASGVVDRVLVLAGPADGEAALARSVAESMRQPGLVLADVPGPQELAALLTHCRLFVGNDSGVTHLAAAVGVPSVAVFGPSNDRAWRPWPARAGRAEVVREQVACSPCIYVGHRPGTPEGCPARTCLDLVEPEAVVAAARRVSLTPHTHADIQPAPHAPSRVS